jgi:hypothetical protein
MKKKGGRALESRQGVEAICRTSKGVVSVLGFKKGVSAFKGS